MLEVFFHVGVFFSVDVFGRVSGFLGGRSLLILVLNGVRMGRSVGCGLGWMGVFFGRARLDGRGDELVWGRDFREVS